MSDITQKIKERLSIQEVIGAYVKLKKAGASYKGLCPFHAEKTPSFTVSPDRHSYFCFGCGAKGDVFTFLEEYEGLDFKDALKTLAERAGVDIREYVPEVRNKKETDRLLDILESATVFFENELRKSVEIRKYRESRGLSDKTEKGWRLGFAPNDWRQLYEHLLKKGYTAGEMLQAGLIKKKDGGMNGGYYDTFRDRLMFPIFDQKGRPVAFSGRIVHPQETQPKYLNSPDTPVFNKSSILYGFDRARRVMRSADYAILVEGQIDLVMSHQGGFSNTVASSGTALTEEHVRMISAHTKRIIVAYDGDKAGLKAAYRASLLMLPRGMDVKVADLPDEKDPGDLAQDPVAWKDIIGKAPRAIDFFYERFVEKETDRKKRITLAREIVFPLLARMESTMEIAHYLGVLADKLGIPRDSVVKDFEKVKSEKINISDKDTAQASEVLRTLTHQESLFAILFLELGREQNVLKPATIESKLKETYGDETFDELKSLYVPRKEELSAYAERDFSGKESAIFEEMLKRAEHERTEQVINNLRSELELAERNKEHDKTKEILKKLLVATKKKERR